MSNDGHWLDFAAELGGAIKAAGAVTFVLGAGCSVTSDCPSTTKVIDAVEAAFGQRLGKGGLDHLHEITTLEQAAVIQPLFSKIEPHAGYLSLAVLGRHVRVVVLDLNWDPLVATACRQLGVQCRAVDIRDLSGIDLARPPEGVTCVHLHGQLANHPRMASLDTLQFDPEQRVAVNAALQHITVVLGTTLIGDSDMMQLLRDCETGPSTWQFSRSGGTVGLGRSYSSKHSPLEGKHGFVPIIAPDVDFDRLMVQVLSMVKGRSFDGEASTHQWVSLPKFKNLVWPEPAILRAGIREPSGVTVMVGEPMLGKSTSAHLTAYLISIWREVLPEIRHFDTSNQIAAAVTSAEATPGIYVLEDPFGATGHFEPNPNLLNVLEQMQMSPGRSKLIIASRLANWQQANNGTGTNVLTLPAAATDWYSKRSLKSAASVTFPDREDLLVRIDQGELSTPAAVKGAADRRPSSGDIVEDKLELLKQQYELRMLCMLVRLQEYAGCLLPRRALADLVTLPASAQTLKSVFLRAYQFESEERLALAHPTDREAVDRALSAELANVEALLRGSMSPSAQRLLGAIPLFNVLSSLTEGKPIEPGLLTQEQISRWAAKIFAVQPTPQTLEALKPQTLDPWATVELAYELVRLWPIFRAHGGHRALQSFAANRSGRGTYALLEACLYLGAAVSGEVHAAIQSSLWTLMDSQDDESVRECVLVIDAFAWRPMPACYREWVQAYSERFADHPLLRGFLRFGDAYHANGTADLAIQIKRGVGPLTAEEAKGVAWLVEWHFVHQAHARTLLARSPIIDKDFLCRSLHPNNAAHVVGAMGALLKSLSDHVELIGWAVLFFCNARGFGLSIDQEAIDYVNDKILLLGNGDVPAILAALTYEPATQLRSLRAYVGTHANIEVALDLIAEGARLDGIRVTYPRFNFVNNPAILEAKYRWEWPHLRQEQIPTMDVSALVVNLESAAAHLVASGRYPAQMLREIIERASQGDLRELEVAIVARDGTAEPYVQMLASSCELRARSQTKLF